MKEITLEATIENIAQVAEFVDEQLADAGCKPGIRTQIEIAIDELMSNIAQYAYAPQTGMVTVRLEILQESRAAKLVFVDQGYPYDPLLQKSPNLDLPIKERKKGGLGIFMVRKTMDEMHYEYADGCNVLSITKAF